MNDEIKSKLTALRTECPEPYGTMTDERIVQILVDRELSVAIERNQEREEEMEKIRHKCEERVKENI